MTSSGLWSTDKRQLRRENGNKLKLALGS